MHPSHDVCSCRWIPIWMCRLHDIMSTCVQEPVPTWEASWNFGNATGQPDTLTSIEGGLLAQPQGSAAFTVISSPGAEPLAPKGGSSTVGILGGVPAVGTFTGVASAIDHVTVNGQQCTPYLPAATDGSTATAQVKGPSRMRHPRTQARQPTLVFTCVQTT